MPSLFAAQMGHFGQIHHGPTKFSEDLLFPKEEDLLGF